MIQFFSGRRTTRYEGGGGVSSDACCDKGAPTVLWGSSLEDARYPTQNLTFMTKTKAQPDEQGHGAYYGGPFYVGPTIYTKTYI